MENQEARQYLINFVENTLNDVNLFLKFMEKNLLKKN